jgi:hypothetical protein
MNAKKTTKYIYSFIFIIQFFKILFKNGVRPKPDGVLNLKRYVT